MGPSIRRGETGHGEITGCVGSHGNKSRGGEEKVVDVSHKKSPPFGSSAPQRSFPKAIRLQKGPTEGGKGGKQLRLRECDTLPRITTKKGSLSRSGGGRGGGRGGRGGGRGGAQQSLSLSLGRGLVRVKRLRQPANRGNTLPSFCSRTPGFGSHSPGTTPPQKDTALV